MSSIVVKVIPYGSMTIKKYGNYKFVRVLDLLSNQEYIIKLLENTVIFNEFIPLWAKKEPVFIRMNECCTFRDYMRDRWSLPLKNFTSSVLIMCDSARIVKEETVKKNYPEFLI